MPEIDDIISQATPSQSSVRVCIRGDLMSEYDDLTSELDELADWTPAQGDGLSPADPRAPIKDRLRELRAEMQESTKKFVFKALGDHAASNLLTKNAPTAEQSEEGFQFNPETYPVALVAAASLTPKMDEEAVGRLFDVFNLPQRNALFSAAMRANNRQVDIPFFEAASEPAANSEPK